MCRPKCLCIPVLVMGRKPEKSTIPHRSGPYIFLPFPAPPLHSNRPYLLQLYKAGPAQPRSKRQHALCLSNLSDRPRGAPVGRRRRCGREELAWCDTPGCLGNSAEQAGRLPPAALLSWNLFRRGIRSQLIGDPAPHRQEGTVSHGSEAAAAFVRLRARGGALHEGVPHEVPVGPGR